ncbi:hypothetical protein [Mycobacterium stomatepiae]|uniref:Uncharacterized protein n=1 Tax=Mycobacterium stomatepiae TaxID=470076 RepID=A0A7I7Q2Z1_9MYCO|nr:hypothetical protein [Mycobacterium stomatepiae]MCV7165816.1 hypothetical protein [Mycobacterium stomatepiae]BBY20683.1 hypothetical protein MSTO_08880 [Mycobacterium stomatepiae]
MMNRKDATVAALCGSVAVLALALGGIGAVTEPQIDAMAPPSYVVPAPPGDGGGALPVKPAGGGGGCISGLNCGPVNPDRPPPPKRQPRLPHGQQQGVQAPQNP